MSMSTGIITVAYGAEYDRCAAHTMAWSRKNTDLPFAVVTNLRAEERCAKWNDVSAIEFIYREESTRDNRVAKLSMDLISPFDKTLYIDADSVIQHSGCEMFVDSLVDHEIAFRFLTHFDTHRPIWRLFVRQFELFGVSKPIAIYYGGVIAFVPGIETRRFYAGWLERWQKTDRGRDMPAQNATIKQCAIKHGILPVRLFGIDAAGGEDYIVVHNGESAFGWRKRFCIPNWKGFFPTDRAEDFVYEGRRAIAKVRGRLKRGRVLIQRRGPRPVVPMLSPPSSPSGMTKVAFCKHLRKRGIVLG